MIGKTGALQPIPPRIYSYVPASQRLVTRRFGIRKSQACGDFTSV